MQYFKLLALRRVAIAILIHNALYFDQEKALKKEKTKNKSIIMNFSLDCLRINESLLFLVFTGSKFFRFGANTFFRIFCFLHLDF